MNNYYTTGLLTTPLYRLGHEDLSLQLVAFAEEEEADLAQLQVPTMAVVTMDTQLLRPTSRNCRCLWLGMFTMAMLTMAMLTMAVLTMADLTQLQALSYTHAIE